ncbi:MAG TPA: AI-2E family transporter [Gemmatimonadaceae bacterium]|nr:AI-2E family transporter [Gemmatimonadaceae bacterium]
MRVLHLEGVTWRSTLPIAAALVLGAGTLILVWLTAEAIGLLILAITLAEALAPIADWLDRYMPRWVAIVVVYLVLFALLGAIGWIVIPALVAQARALIALVPTMIDKFHGFVSRWDRLIGGHLEETLPGWVSGATGFVVQLPLRVLQWVIDLAIIVFLSIYWLFGSPSITRFALSLLPEPRRARAGRVLHDMGRSMGGYVRGTVIDAAIMGAFAWLGLFLIGVHYPVVLGVLTMCGELIPIIGPVTVGVLVVLVALFQSFTKAVFAAILYTVLVQLEAHLLAPNVMETQTDVPQTLVIFAIAAGGALGGFLGVLVSIPVAAALRVFVLEVVAPAERRGVGAPQPADSEAPPHDGTGAPVS